MTGDTGGYLRRHALAAMMIVPLAACGANAPTPKPAPAAATPVRERGARSVEEMLTQDFSVSALMDASDYRKQSLLKKISARGANLLAPIL